MKTTLYLISHTDDDGDVLDLFVEATTPAQAVILWRQHYADAVPESAKPQMIFEAPALRGAPRAVPWGALPGVVGWQL